MIKFTVRYFGVFLLIFSICSTSYTQNNQVQIEELMKKVESLEKIVTKQQQEIRGLKQTQQLTSELKKEVDQILEGKKGDSKHHPILAPLGLDFHIYASLDIMGSEGIDQSLHPEDDRIDGTLSAYFAISANPIKNGTAFLLFEVGTGSGLDGKIPTWGGINDESGFDKNIAIAELWYEHSLLGDRLQIRFGYLDFSTMFDTNNVANDGSYQFKSSALVNNRGLELPGSTLDYTLGITAWFSVIPGLKVGCGIGDGDGDWDQVFDNLYAIGEIQFSFDLLHLPKKIKENWEGNYRFYIWINDADHTDLRASDSSRANYGFGLSFDQKIAGAVMLFLRYGHQRERVAEYGDALSGGLEVLGKLWKRDEDAFGIGWSHIFPSSIYRSQVQRPDGIDSDNESLLEIYYRLSINEYVSVTPAFQVWNNVAGNDDNDTFITFSVRGALYF